MPFKYTRYRCLNLCVGLLKICFCVQYTLFQSFAMTKNIAFSITESHASMARHRLLGFSNKAFIPSEATVTIPLSMHKELIKFFSLHTLSWSSFKSNNYFLRSNRNFFNWCWELGRDHWPMWCYLVNVLLHLHNNNVITKVVKGERNLKYHADCVEQPVLPQTLNVL